MRNFKSVNDSRAQHRIVARLWCVMAGAVLIGLFGSDSHADDQRLLKAKAPRDQRIVGSKPGGFYFIAKPLKEEYDKLLYRVYALRAEIVGGKISSQQAAAEVRVLQSELQRVRQLIDATKTFIAAGAIATKTETTEFELGPEKLLFINESSKIHLVGWDQPGVKCVLDKIVLGDADQQVDDHFAGIRLVHRHGPAKDGVGRSREERQADEAAFVASPEGKKLTSDQLKARQARIEKTFAAQDYFRPFQSKAIDYLELEGLTYQQGNRQVSYEVLSAGGDGRAGSTWQRDSSLTIYVPSCAAIGIRGGLGGLEVEGVKAPLIVRGEGNRDYDSHSHVKDHEGSLTIENIPLEVIENVRGDVSVIVSADLGNSGIRYQEGTKTQFVEMRALYDYRNIGGDLTALLLNVNLHVSEIIGRVNITNEFGDTQFMARAPLSAGAHRVVSESGNITLQLAKDALQNTPLVAVSECGTVRIADGAPPLVDGNISCWPDGLIRRTYRGFATKGDSNPPFDRFERFERIQYIFNREEHRPGLDVLSRSGLVQIEPVEN